jgi:hypothetical protein
MTRVALALSCLLATACVSYRTPDAVDELLRRAVVAAEQSHRADLDAEAAVLLHAVRAVDPLYPGLRELEAQIDPGLRVLMDRGPLGMNRKLRPHYQRSLGQRMALWLPDRLLDLLDVVSVSVHMGPGVFANYHLTRGFQAGAGFRSTGGVGIHDFRSVGLKSQAEAELVILPAGAQSYSGALLGTSGVHGTGDSFAGIHRPSYPLYQDFRDYWGIGASATVIFLGAEWEVHPVQLADFVAGFFSIDFLNDDFGHTRGLQYRGNEPMLLREIWEVHRSEETHAQYLAARDHGDLPRFADEGAPVPRRRAPRAEPTTPLPASPEDADH